MSRNFELLRRLQNEPRNTEIQKKDREVYPQRLRSRGLYRQAAHPSDGLAKVRATLRKRYRLATIFAASVFVTVAIVTLGMKPVYESSATIEIDPPGTQAFSLDARGAASDTAEYLETQAKSLLSTQLALNLIRKLHLDQNPDFVRASKRRLRPDSPQLDDGGAQLTPSEKVALKTFTQGLKVRRDTSSRLITVSFASHNPKIAAEIANSLVKEFIENTHKTQYEAIMESSAWLSRQLDDIRGKMEQANQELTDFQKMTGIADVDANRNASTTVAERMSELERQLAQARADRIQLQAFLERAHGSPSSLPQIRENPVIQQLSQKLAEARVELAQAQVIYGNNHPTLKKIQSQVNQLQEELHRHQRGTLAELRKSYAASRSRERLLQEEAKSTTNELKELAHYLALKKQAQTDTDLYNSLYGRIKEAGIAASSNSNNIRVVDLARILDHPTRPKVLLNLALGLLGGVFGGVVVAFIREAFDDKIYTPEDIRSVTGISAISVLPVIGTGDAACPALATNGLLRSWQKNRNRWGTKFLLERPNSVEAEALRGLSTNVILSHSEGPPRTILVTSAFPNEGKTTVASNLAIALARRGSTCLVDADLRKSGVATTFGVDPQYGLADVLTGSADLDQAIYPIPEVPNLSVVTAGAEVHNPGELIGMRATSGAVRALRERFQFVVFDSPPILPYAEARVLATLSEGVILVGRNGTTTRDAIFRSMELLSEIHASPILAFVLNGADAISPRYQYYRGGRAPR
jgi:polysaccharide biosynthesis transport protein